MPSKITFLASAATLALALVPASLAAPLGPVATPQCMPQCKSLGKGILGLPTAFPEPAQLQIDRLDVNDAGKLQTQIYGGEPVQQFELFQCAQETDYPGPRSMSYFQGHIRDHNGKCVTIEISELTSKPIGVKTEDCHFTDNGKLGGVIDTQHFQFEKNGMSDFYQVEFLGRVEGPIKSMTNPGYNLWTVFDDVDVGFEIKRDSQCNGAGCSFLTAQIHQ